LNLGRSASR